MRAGVAGADGGKAVFGKGCAKGGIVAQGREMALHFGFVARHQIVLARPEQPFGLRHGALTRDAAGEGLEDADGRDAGEKVDIEAARTRRRKMAREDLRSLGVRQPAPIARAILPESAQRVFGIATP